jgi:mxaJ protein
LARGEVDVAIVWGPLAGYFAPRSGVAMEITPVTPQIDPPFLPFVFDISMGVRRGDTLRTRLDDIIVRHRAEIDAILRDYGVPRAEGRRM